MTPREKVDHCLWRFEIDETRFDDDRGRWPDLRIGQRQMESAIIDSLMAVVPDDDLFGDWPTDIHEALLVFVDRLMADLGKGN